MEPSPPRRLLDADAAVGVGVGAGRLLRRRRRRGGAATPPVGTDRDAVAPIAAAAHTGRSL